ncbi:XRE family transcriptional regulator [Actinomycetaceae bacterium MB13-C1-2]|nr:XRE family transcriptional regulator [Actinomycetaceae bacterium MB13-C1-2]
MSAGDRLTAVATFFDGARLTTARQLAGLRKTELANAIGKSPASVTAWESGKKRPSPATVGQLSLGLGVAPEFFTSGGSDAALLSTPHFRSLRSTTQLARDQASAYGRIALEISVALERHVEFPEISIPSIPVDLDQGAEGTPEDAARALREKWELGDGPVGHLVRILENHGILVVFSPPQTSTVDAYSFESKVRPVVVLNPLKRDYYRQRFDVAHELGHLVMHSDSEPGGRVIEDEANRFAAELLMPGDQIRSLLPTSMGRDAWRKLARLKEEWGVSIQALLYRARHLGNLSDVSYRNAMMSLSSRGWRRDEPGRVRTMEQPSLMPRAVALLDDEGVDLPVLLEESCVPGELFDVATARVPGVVASELTEEASRKVVSLLPHLK